MFEIYLLFFLTVLPLFTTFNLFLQHDAPQIHVLYRQIDCLLHKALSKFVKPAIIQQYQNNLVEDELHNEALENQLEDSKLFIGLVTASEVQKRLQNGDIASEKVKVFYCAVRNFYTTVISYILRLAMSGKKI